MEGLLKKILVCALFVLLALFSFLILGNKCSAPETHAATTASLESEINTVLKLTAASTGMSAGLSLLPGDAATPISEKFADFTEYFLVILCVLYAEKYLLTIIGAGTFKILIPIASLLLVGGLFAHKQGLKRLSIKLAVFGIAMYIAIPLSVKVSDAIYTAYDASINETISAAEQITQTTEEFGNTEDEGLIQQIMDKLSVTAEGLTERATQALNNFVESLAVMMVTSCIIPILVILFFIWLIKMLTGFDVLAYTKPNRENGKTTV